MTSPYESVLQGLLSKIWQVAIAMLAMLFMIISRLEGQAKRSLPLYRQMEEYGIVSAADESKIL